MQKFLTIFTALSFIIGIQSCVTSDMYQSQVDIKDGKWYIADQPTFTFNVTDTAAMYNTNMIIRHDDTYPYNNVWLKLLIQKPNDSIYTDSVQIDFTLSDEKGYWLGLAQGNFYVHKLRIPEPTLATFTHSGTYTIKVKQMMRKDPLPAILNVGLQISKRKD